jgi:hypothetical protein
VTEKEEKKIFWYWFTREGLAGTSWTSPHSNREGGGEPDPEDTIL